MININKTQLIKTSKSRLKKDEEKHIRHMVFNTHIMLIDAAMV